MMSFSIKGGLVIAGVKHEGRMCIYKWRIAHPYDYRNRSQYENGTFKLPSIPNMTHDQSVKDNIKALGGYVVGADKMNHEQINSQLTARYSKLENLLGQKGSDHSGLENAYDKIYYAACLHIPNHQPSLDAESTNTHNSDETDGIVQEGESVNTIVLADRTVSSQRG
jgi:hypothetical protein